MGEALLEWRKSATGKVEDPLGWPSRAGGVQIHFDCVGLHAPYYLISDVAGRYAPFRAVCPRFDGVRHPRWSFSAREAGERERSRLLRPFRPDLSKVHVRPA